MQLLKLTYQENDPYYINIESISRIGKIETGYTRIELRENRYGLANESVEEVIGMIRYAHEHPDQCVVSCRKVN